MHVWLNLLRLIAPCAATFVLSGCGESSELFYLYGPTKECAARNKEVCQFVKLYDKVELKVLQDRQEVTLVQTAVGLDSSNTAYKKLENCKVVSDASFSCDGLTRLDNAFTDTSIFGQNVLSRSYWTYSLSLVDKGHKFKRSTIQWWNDNDGWLIPMIVAVLIMMLGMAAE